MVHKGILNGKQVAIKIKRPNIDKQIKNSLWHTRILKHFMLVTFSRYI